MTFSEDHLIPLVDRGLGNSAYLVDLGDGRALVVDPSRDLRAVYEAARSHRLRIVFAAETHLHADFLSGGVQLRHDVGARILASAMGGRAFPHTGLDDGQEVDLGGLTLQAVATPGHTDEHLSYLLLDGGHQLGVFTGGSLMVGSAARTDLLGPRRTDELARAQYRSLHRLASLPDQTKVWPTHGAGSFCAGPTNADRTTTIGAEKRTNRLLADLDEDRFVEMLTSGFGSYPDYFDHLAERNRCGPDLLPLPTPLHERSLADAVRLAARQDATIIDVRPAAEYAAGHLVGSISIPLTPSFATWLGWLTPETARILLVANRDQDEADLLGQMAKIGYDNVIGRLTPATHPDWRTSHLTTTTFATAGQLPAAQPYVDVRQRAEFATGHIEAAISIELGDLATAIKNVPPGAVVACGHGERAMTAASILERAGRTDITVLNGGPHEFVHHHGGRLTTVEATASSS